jgi:hypothetical protein
MSDERGLLYAESVEHGDVVARPGRHVIPLVRLTRRNKAAAGDPDDVKVIGELIREPVIDVRVITETRKQHHRARILLAAPIEHFEADARFDFHELHRVWRRIATRGGLRAAWRARRVSNRGGSGRHVARSSRVADVDREQQHDRNSRLAKRIFHVRPLSSRNAATRRYTRLVAHSKWNCAKRNCGAMRFIAAARASTAPRCFRP